MGGFRTLGFMACCRHVDTLKHLGVLIVPVLTWTDSYSDLWPWRKPSRRERADLFLGTMWKQEDFKRWEVRLAELSFTRWALVDSRNPLQLWTFVFPRQTCFIKTHGYTSLLGFLADLWGTCMCVWSQWLNWPFNVCVYSTLYRTPKPCQTMLFIGQAYNPAFPQKRSPTIHILWIQPREAEQCQERSCRWSQWCISVSQGIWSPHVTLLVDVVEESARIAGLGFAPTKSVFERAFCQTFASHAYRI